MRNSFENLVKSTLFIKYCLPNGEISKSVLTTEQDYCFYGKTDEEIARIIYNGIIEYAKDEDDIDYFQLDKEQVKALQNDIRYDENGKRKRNYGFYGEVLLYIILYLYLNSKPILSRGHFYIPTSRAEVTGYDSYHLLKHDDNIELWFGEAKFREDFKKSINEVVEKFEKVFSNNYFYENIMNISKMKKYIINNIYDFDILNKICDEWKEKVVLNLNNELQAHNINLVYPILIGCDEIKNYDETIKKCIELIKNKCEGKVFNFNIKAEILFIFLPVKNINEIKDKVISWISTQEPLI